MGFRASPSRCSLGRSQSSPTNFRRPETMPSICRNEPIALLCNSRISPCHATGRSPSLRAPRTSLHRFLAPRIKPLDSGGENQECGTNASESSRKRLRIVRISPAGYRKAKCARPANQLVQDEVAEFPAPRLVERACGRKALGSGCSGSWGRSEAIGDRPR